MDGLRRHIAALLLLLGLAVLSPYDVQAGEEADLALVLAVDVSESMDVVEQELQRQGFVEAFRSSVVHEAFRDGMLGCVAVIYMEWAGLHSRNVVVPRTIIEGPEGAAAFADRLSQSPISRARWSSISGAIDFSLDLLASSPVEAARQVIDVSGDGGNNQGRIVTEARDAALARGITINGLPIMLKRPRSAWDTEHLDLYYQDCVIGGSGAFMIPIREMHQFAEAIRTKLVREIAGLSPEALLQEAQDRPPVNCLLSRNWDYWRN